MESAKYLFSAEWLKTTVGYSFGCCVLLQMLKVVSVVPSVHVLSLLCCLSKSVFVTKLVSK